MSSITTPVAAAGAARSTSGKPRIGDTVLVLLDPGVRRPLLVTFAGMVTIHERQTADVSSRDEFRVSGTLFCEPEDHTSTAIRTLGSRPGDPAKIYGRPDRHMPIAYAEHLAPGPAIGQWTMRTQPTNEAPR